MARFFLELLCNSLPASMARLRATNRWRPPQHLLHNSKHLAHTACTCIRTGGALSCICMLVSLHPSCVHAVRVVCLFAPVHRTYLHQLMLVPSTAATASRWTDSCRQLLPWPLSHPASCAVLLLLPLCCCYPCVLCVCVHVCTGRRQEGGQCRWWHMPAAAAHAAATAVKLATAAASC